MIATTIGVVLSAPLLLYGTLQRHQVAYIPAVSFTSFLSFSDVLFGGVILTVVFIVL